MSPVPLLPGHCPGANTIMHLIIALILGAGGCSPCRCRPLLSTRRGAGGQAQGEADAGTSAFAAQPWEPPFRASQRCCPWSPLLGMLWPGCGLRARGAGRARGMLKLLPAHPSGTSSWGDITPRSFTAPVLLLGSRLSVGQPKRTPGAQPLLLQPLYLAVGLSASRVCPLRCCPCRGERFGVWMHWGGHLPGAQQERTVPARP